MTSKKKGVVAVAMSGGVDSSVSAYLLQKEGYELFGLFMKNWEEEGHCSAEQDQADVLAVCERLSIPCYTVNFTGHYREQVFSEFLRELKAGRTPNPDILCNKIVKFDLLLHKALRLGASFLATGHYCRTALDEEGKPLLLKGSDPSKEQSYFLHAIEGGVLRQVLFPVGALRKQQVRQIAEEAALATAHKRDSTGICFIGKRNFGQFIQSYIGYQPGPIVTMEGKLIGEHQGIAYYTIGQRKGLAIGGAATPWFVANKEIETNRLVVVQGQDHPALFCLELLADSHHWISGQPPSLPFRCKAKVRYRQEEKSCWLLPVADSADQLLVRFDEPQRAVTPGQSVVFYSDQACLGGAIIRERL